MASEKLGLPDKLVGESGSSAPTASPVTLASSSVRPPLENQTAAEEEASVIRQGEITLHNNRFELIQVGVP